MLKSYSLNNNTTPLCMHFNTCNQTHPFCIYPYHPNILVELHFFNKINSKLPPSPIVMQSLQLQFLVKYVIYRRHKSLSAAVILTDSAAETGLSLTHTAANEKPAPATALMWARHGLWTRHSSFSHSKHCPQYWNTALLFVL